MFPSESQRGGFSTSSFFVCRIGKKRIDVWNLCHKRIYTKITHPERAVLTGSGVSMLLQKYKVFLINTNQRIDISHKLFYTIYSCC